MQELSGNLDNDFGDHCLEFLSSAVRGQRKRGECVLDHLPPCPQAFSPSMPPALANKRALPSKEAGHFKELLNLYETRQLKKGLKTADQILKKFPEHGGTEITAGLCSNSCIVICRDTMYEGSCPHASGKTGGRS